MKIFALKKGDLVVEKLTNYVKEHSIKSGLIIGIGALSSVELMSYNLETKEYSSQKLQGALEIGSFSAVIGKDPEGNAHIHPHIVVSGEDFAAKSGHVKEAVVGATFEAVVLVSDQVIERYADSEIGLNLIQ